MVHNELFLRFISAQNLFEAWRRFVRGKRGSIEVLKFERRLEYNIFELRHRLQTDTYTPDAYESFTIFDPKQRTIHKACIQDRLVHQALVQVIEPVFENRFIFDTYSCRKEKGTHAALFRLQSFLRQTSRNNTRTIFALKCDVRRFFDTVDHQLLYQMLEARIVDGRLCKLIWLIIDSFHKTPGKGLPLGSLTSQLFANVYLHELDWFIKHHLRIDYYLRYCDDFIMLDHSRDRLIGLLAMLRQFLLSKLALELHPNKISLRTWHQGIDFVGYVLKPRCILLRHKTKIRMLKRVNQSNLQSYLGLCKHADAHELTSLVNQIVH